MKLAEEEAGDACFMFPPRRSCPIPMTEEPRLKLFRPWHGTRSTTVILPLRFMNFKLRASSYSIKIVYYIDKSLTKYLP